MINIFACHSVEITNEKVIRSLVRGWVTNVHRSIVNYGMFVKITRMANERYFLLICGKSNVLKSCSSGNCERKCIISYNFFLSNGSTAVLDRGLL